MPLEWRALALQLVRWLLALCLRELRELQALLLSYHRL
jgi:hypothetical protein